MNGHARAILLGAAVVFLPAAAQAQQEPQAQAPEIDIGQDIYMDNCAVCHGESGEGDGPLAGMITERVSDLTALSAQNQGVFPSTMSTK